MRTLALFLLPFIYIQANAQEHIAFSSINANNGLSDNGVRNIRQLRDGRMLIVTQGIVNIYDGTNFSYIHYSDPKAYRLSNFYGWHINYIDDADNFWLKHQHKLYLFDVNRELHVTDIDSIFKSQGIKNPVADLIVDSEYNTWYITDNNKLLFRERHGKQAVLYLSDIDISDSPNDPLIDVEKVDNNLFLFYKSGLMVCYDFHASKELYRENPIKGMENSYPLTIGVLPLDKKYLYIVRNGYDVGISFRFNIETRTWEKILRTNCWQNTLTLDSLGNCWISTFQGLWLIDRSLKKREIISPLQLVDGREFETEITTQYNDRSGGLWVGSINRGLLYYHPERFKFRNIGKSVFKHPHSDGLRVNSFVEIDNNKILVGTRNGLYVYSIESGTLELYNRVPEDTHCHRLFKDSQEQIWVCSNNHGLFRIDNHRVKEYDLPVGCLNIHEATDGTLYLCTYDGIGTFDPTTGDFKEIKVSPEHSLGATFFLNQLGDNKLIGISMAGIFIFNIEKKTFSFPEREKGVMFHHSNYTYHCILSDSRGLVWFGTQDGLYVYNHATAATKAFHYKDGLVNNAIRSIVEDRNGDLWVSTSNGISRVEVSGDRENHSYSFVNYNHYDGIIENEFIARSVLKTSDNHLFWGGIDGFNTINLNRIDSSLQRLSPPLITNLYLFGSRIKYEEEYNGGVILSQPISSSKQIGLKHNQNFLGVEFSALNYVNPSQTYYKYMLEGLDATWNYVHSADGIGRANYTNLHPGTYTLKVYAANNSRIWSDSPAELTIVVYPPIWRTTWAYFIYIMVTLGAVAFIMHSLVKRHKQRIISKQKAELEEFKMSFYTNISHELRTPLTLIITPLEAILRRLKDEMLKNKLWGIYSNAKDLLGLVNQLLDFRKLEMKGETLRLSFCCVDEYLMELTYPFKELANEKGIKFTYVATTRNLYAYLDKDKFQKIINNLLSNAFKFTPRGGSIVLNLNKTSSNDDSTPKLLIQVSDTGCGIPKDDLPLIFDCFYQGKKENSLPGSGIGLHLVKEYIQMHKGRIDVESWLGQGSGFTIEIPCDIQPTNGRYMNQTGSAERYMAKILVIEDNRAFRSFMANELSEYYEVLEASNGVEGLKIAKEELPDLVISDIMMPGMSGTELCNELKHDLLTSHIPVILLTARASDEAQVEGLRARADAYITKPFNLEILQLRILSLIEQQEKRKELFKNAIVLNPESLAPTDIDKELIEKALTQIEKNLDNISYSVEKLSSDLCMDRTGLYRKLVAIVGQTPTDFIRSVRLKKAAHLLENGHSVYEVSESVGFGSASYFIKCFQKEYGMKPSHFKNKQVHDSVI